MLRGRVLIWTITLAVLLGVSLCHAQTITIVSGNGQLTAPMSQTTRPYFDPLVVRVRDAQGNPAAGVTVNWTLVSGIGSLTTTSSITDTTGLAQSGYYQTTTFGSLGYFLSMTTITASYANAVATFYLTQVQAVAGFSGRAEVTVYPDMVNNPGVGTTLTGAAGTVSNTPFKVQVLPSSTTNGYTGVPNVAVILAPRYGSTATISCQGTPGAGEGIVLTDATGSATCVPVFGNTQGTGQFDLVVGGVASSTSYYDPLTGATTSSGYYQTGPFNVKVTSGGAARVAAVSNASQNAVAGQSLALTAKVTDAAGNGLSGVAVTWTVSPSSGGTLTQTTGTSDSNGQVTTTLALSPVASGTVNVTAALTSNSSVSTNFAITIGSGSSGGGTVTPTPSTLTKVSGDGQEAVVGKPFDAPLVVQYGSTAGQPVIFNVANGSGTLSVYATATDASGRAQVNVTAGANTGPLTVVAIVNNQTVTFNLNVRNVGIVISADNFYNGVGFQKGGLSPCGIGYLTGTNILPGVQGLVSGSANFGPLPTKLGSFTLLFGNSYAPLFYVSNSGGLESVSFQVPCDVTPGKVDVVVGVGNNETRVTVDVAALSPGILEWTDPADSKKRAVLVKPDGTFVSVSNPARPGEVLKMYVTGIGQVTSTLRTNQVGQTDFDMTAINTVIVGVSNQGVRVVSAKYATNLVGLFEVSFQMPDNASTGDLVLAIGVTPSGGATVYGNASVVVTRQ